MPPSMHELRERACAQTLFNTIRWSHHNVGTMRRYVHVGVWELTADLNDLERVLEERPVVGVDARLAQVALLAHVDEHAAELLLIVAHVHLQAPRQRLGL